MQTVGHVLDRSRGQRHPGSPMLRKQWSLRGLLGGPARLINGYSSLLCRAPGGEVRDLLSTDGHKLGRFNGAGIDVLPGITPVGEAAGNCSMSADLVGDYRDEIVCIGTNSKGTP